ncbi:MAG: hypothetical protein ABSE18_02065 [Minisyncoccia bacterium]|jgi:hypothetical protein
MRIWVVVIIILVGISSFLRAQMRPRFQRYGSGLSIGEVLGPFETCRRGTFGCDRSQLKQLKGHKETAEIIEGAAAYDPVPKNVSPSHAVVRELIAKNQEAWAYDGVVLVEAKRDFTFLDKGETRKLERPIMFTFGTVLPIYANEQRLLESVIYPLQRVGKGRQVKPVIWLWFQHEWLHLVGASEDEAYTTEKLLIVELTKLRQIDGDVAEFLIKDIAAEPKFAHVIKIPGKLLR